VGQPASAVLAVAVSVRHRLDGRESLRRYPFRALWRCAAGGDWKGKLSPFVYVLGIISTFLWTWVGQALYVAVALLWLVPDRRIERSLHRNGAGSS